MRRLLSFILCMVTIPAIGQTLGSITLTPPSTGYLIEPVGGTVQLTALCLDTTGATMMCPTLTWGSDDPDNLSVTSSGLVSMGPGNGGAITAISRTSNAVSVTTAYSSLYNITNKGVIISGVTDSSFNGNHTINGGTNPFHYSQTAADSSSSGGSVYYGSSEIYAYSAADPTVLTGHHPITVDNGTSTSLSFAPEAYGANTSSSVATGSTVGVSAYDQNTVGVGNYCAWTSSDATKATVNSIGEVTGVAPGTPTITCTYGTMTASRTLTIYTPKQTLSTWYVRPGGGTRYDAAVPTGQCDGTANVDYPGTGVGQACAFNQLMYCFTDESSSSVYTGAVQSGDTCLIAQGNYTFANKAFGTHWITQGGGEVFVPSGTPAHPTKIVGACYPSCSSNPDAAGNRPQLTTYTAFIDFWLRGVQNVLIYGIDMAGGADCNPKLSGYIDYACPGGTTEGSVSGYMLSGDTFSANIEVDYSRFHAAFYGWGGTQGPGLVMNYDSFEGMNSTGLSFDDVNGHSGVNRADGFSAHHVTVKYAGDTEEQPKPVTSVSRDGSGNMTVVFPANTMVNYIVGNNIVLSGMTPSDLNGTFPVSAITFNQQTLAITGGTCSWQPNLNIRQCVYDTSTAPAFPIGSFINVTGASFAPSNGYWEVNSISGDTVTVMISIYTYPSISAGTLTSGGTISTATSLTATAAGSSESASVVGTASHVHPFHRAYDQGVNGNGDCVGTGVSTIGAWISDYGDYEYCMQDGWDMLHSEMISSIYTHNYSAGNEGATSKFGNADYATYTDNVSIGTGMVSTAVDPDRPPDYSEYVAQPYRANDTILLSSNPWSHFSVSNNTTLTAFDTVIDSKCNSLNPTGCRYLPSLSYFVMQNNAFWAFTDSNYPGGPSGSYPGIYCNYSCNASPAPDPTWTWQYNFGINSNGSASHAQPSGGTGNQWTKSSLFVAAPANITNIAGEANVLNNKINQNIQATSPNIGAGIQNAYTPTDDNVGYPMSNPPVVGALMFQSGTPTAATPSCTPAAGHYTSTLSVTCSSTTPASITYCTIDGSTPTTSSPVCTGISVATSATVKAISAASGYLNSSVASYAYTITGGGASTVSIGGNTSFSGSVTIQ